LEANGSPRPPHAGTAICHRSQALALGREARKESSSKPKWLNAPQQGLVTHLGKVTGKD